MSVLEPFLVSFFIALFVAIAWCFWPKKQKPTITMAEMETRIQSLESEVKKLKQEQAIKAITSAIDFAKQTAEYVNILSKENEKTKKKKRK
jgi:hypothetical protein